MSGLLRTATTSLLQISLFLTTAISPALAGNDPIETVLDSYIDESKKNGSTPADPDYYNKWRTTLLEVARAHKSSPFYHTAMKHVVALSNSAAQYDKSEQTALEAIDTLKDPKNRALWYMELGEVRREMALRAFEAGKSEDAKKLANRAIAAFKDLSQSAGAGDGRDVELSELSLMGTSMSASLCTSILNDSDQARRFFLQGLKISESLQGVKGIVGAESLGYDPEHFAGSVIVSAINSNHPGDAKAALDVASKIKNGRWPPSFYAHTYSSLKFPKGGDEYQAFVADWVSRQPRDKWTGILLFYSARDLYRRGQADEAEKLYLKLLNEYSVDLLEADKDALAEGRGGYMAEIHDHLARIYQQSGRLDLAAAVIADFKKLLPNDARLENVSALQESKVSDAAAHPKEGPEVLKTTPKTQRSLLMGFNVLVVVFVGVFLWRRKKSSHPAA